MTLTQVEPVPTYAPRELVNQLNNLYSLAKRSKQPLRSDWMRNYRLVNNKTYSSDLSSNGMPNVSDSEVFPILSSRIAWMTDQKIMADVMAAAPTGAAFGDHMGVLAQHLEQVIDTLFQVNGWDGEIVKALWDSAQFGAGILKAVWDSGLDNGLGNVSIMRVDPWSFYIDPDATSLNDAQYMFEVQKMSYAEIERRFPASSEQMITDAVLFGDSPDQDMRPMLGNTQSSIPMAWPAVLPGSGGNQGGGAWGLEGQGSGVHTDNVLSQAVAVYTCWIRENYRIERETTDASLQDEEPVVMDSWRVVVYSGGTVLLDELAENLYQESRHPYVRFCDEELGDFWTTPIASHLAPCQIAVNRLLSSLQSSAELTGNPLFMDTSNSGLARNQIMNRPGQRLTMNSAAANNPGGKPGWLEPPKMSSDVMQLVNMWIGRMENISGLSGPSKGQASTGHQPAQQSVQATQEAGFVRIRLALRNLERALGRLFQLCANLIIQNYDVPRVVAIVGDDGVDTALRLAARHFYMPARNPKDGKMLSIPMKFSLIVKAGSSAPTSRSARIAEADALFAMKAIDSEAVLQVHQWPNYQVILQRMAAAAQAAAQQEQAQHQQARGPGTGHAH